uniref:Cytochrome b5 heme-binding domain-containing protein n=1 Tax=Macrostomum lignano TaxID=282301 RepID=A0A1I8H1C2_9PLAT
MKIYTWESLKEFQQRDCKQKLIVIEGKVYDVTKFMHKHPGGAKLLGAYAGEDATDAWVALHNDKELVENRPARISDAYASWPSRPLVRAAAVLHQVPAPVLGIRVGRCAAAMAVRPAHLDCTASGPAAVHRQAQAGWAQHDYGHLSVFNSRRLNHIGHELVVGHMKGASSHWWNFRHFLHHSKPNVVGADPDINVPYLFLLGDKMPQEWGKRRRGFMPYNWQHDYFWLLGPPMLLPLYFHYENIYFIFKRGDWRDFVWTLSFFLKFFFYVFNHFFPSWLATFGFYICLCATWIALVFVACTQMSHIPMDIDRDQRREPPECRRRLINDWFTGHLNYQIEHHLFPTMPRHSYPLVQPHVKQLCARHGIPYVEKPLSTALADIIRSLKKSGELWLEAYQMPG